MPAGRVRNEHREARAAIRVVRAEQRCIEAAIQNANDHNEVNWAYSPLNTASTLPLLVGRVVLSKIRTLS